MKRRLLWAATISICFGIVVAFLLAVPLVENLYRDEVQTRLNGLLALMVNEWEEAEVPNAGEFARSWAVRLEAAGQPTRITLISPTSGVLADSGAEIPATDTHLDRKEIIEASRSGRGYDIRRSSTLGTRFFYAAYAGSSVIFRAALPMSNLEQTSRLLWACAFVGGVAGAIAALGAAVLLSRRLLRPIDDLIAASEAIAQGDLSYRATTSLDEIGKLAQAFNSMAVNLRRLEQVRSEFVSNVTHELKTPLTSIRGYVELLQSGVRNEATRSEFYEIIDIEAERLHVLIDELLDISEIENNVGQEQRVKACDLGAVLFDVESRLQPLAEKAKVELQVAEIRGLTIAADPQRIRQLISNLLDNAIKYNRPDGWVRVDAQQQQGYVVITVEDNGIGIAPEHHARLFERFYRVDKSRSRELGGTGLGLSIVKHIVQLYGGEISVVSRPGEGSTFQVRLPN